MTPIERLRALARDARAQYGTEAALVSGEAIDAARQGEGGAE
ncbi:hypothetical protein [Xenophilus sp. Marseille-Q4582]|nr:hypothetical protein [Xenophilus sp. Marseille-Q4582]